MAPTKRTEGWRMELPGETIRSCANLIARVNVIFETAHSSALWLPRVVRGSAPSR